MTLDNVEISQLKSTDLQSEYDQLLVHGDDARCHSVPTTHSGGSISLARFVYVAFFLTCGGPYGLETAVSTGGAAITLIGLLVLALIWSIPQSLMTAELSTMMPQNGGSVIWVYRGLGHSLGALNAINAFVAGLVDKCIYPNIFLAYWPGASESPTAMLIGRPMLLIAMTALNAAGIETVADSLAMMLLGTMAVFVVEIPYAVTAFRLVDFARVPKDIDWGVLLSCLLWASTGWDSIGSIAGEVVAPHRTVPVGMGLAVAMATLAYVVPVAVGYALMPDPLLWSTGNGLGSMTVVSGLLSCLGLCNAGIASTGQMLCAMGQQTESRGRVVPAWFGRRSASGVPLRSLWVQCVVMCALVQTDLTQLIQLEMVFACVALLLEFATFVALRKNEPYAVLVVVVTLIALVATNPIACAVAVAVNSIAFVVFQCALAQ